MVQVLGKTKYHIVCDSYSWRSCSQSCYVSNHDTRFSILRLVTMNHEMFNAKTIGKVHSKGRHSHMWSITEVMDPSWSIADAVCRPRLLIRYAAQYAIGAKDPLEESIRLLVLPVGFVSTCGQTSTLPAEAMDHSKPCQQDQRGNGGLGAKSRCHQKGRKTEHDESPGGTRLCQSDRRVGAASMRYSIGDADGVEVHEKTLITCSRDDESVHIVGLILLVHHCMLVISSPSWPWDGCTSMDIHQYSWYSFYCSAHHAFADMTSSAQQRRRSVTPLTGLLVEKPYQILNAKRIWPICTFS